LPIALLLLALVTGAALAQSSLKLFWWDELASYDIAQLPHYSDVWKFFRAGLDTPSPVPTLIVQATFHWIGNSEVLARLPFTVGFLVSCFCLYGITVRRYGPGYAWSALLMPAISGTFYFASELRTYGIVLGAISFAFYCWQGIPKRGLYRTLGIVGLFAGLALSVLCHVFTFFALVPFAAAQIVRDWHARRIDVPVWVAILLAPLCLAVEVPGMQAAHRIYASTFWSKPNQAEILWSYSYAIGFGWLVAVIIVLLAIPALAKRISDLQQPGKDRRGLLDSGFDRAEWTFIALLALQPVFAWPLSHLVGVYNPRYVLSLTVGVVLVVVAGIAEALKRNRIAGVVLAATFLLAFAQDKHHSIAEALRNHESCAAALEKQPWIRVLENSPLPVIAPNTPVYTETSHYIPPALEQRFYYTMNTPAAIRLDEEAGAALSMRLFSQAGLPLRVVEFSAFAAQHPSFLVLVEAPLDPYQSTSDLSVHLIGNYQAPERFGRSYISVYQVDVIHPPAARH
jgi:hypothetical protein